MTALDVLQGIFGFLASLLTILLQAAVFAAGYLLVMRGGTGISRLQNRQARRRGVWPWRYFERESDRGVRFDDVIGCDEAKREVQEYVEFLREPRRFREIGAKVPRGFLLVGPPGTGKTLLAKAMATEADVPFYALSGSEFTEVFVGVGAARVRQVYRQARRHPAAIVFIDEIDALATARGRQFGIEADQTLNQFLVELDGFGPSNVLTIGATNRVDALDPALVRPGRLDRTVAVSLPDLEARERLFGHYLNQVKAVEGINKAQVARAAWNMSGAEIAAAVNEASFIAVRDGRPRITQFDLNRGIERILFGSSSQRKINAPDRRLVAIHEAGHAVVDYCVRSDRFPHKLTIVPVGTAAGYSWSVQDEDKLSYKTRATVFADLQVYFAGLVAEELFHEAGATPPGEDLRQAARLARWYIWESGISGEFLANYEQMGNLSESTRERLDRAVEQVLAQAKAEARATLESHRAEHARLVDALMERESLYGDDILRALKGPLPEIVQAAQEKSSGV